MKVEIEIDRERCTGIGICESLSPDYFELDDDAELLLLRAEVAPGDVDELEATVRGCPAGALRLVNR